MHFEQTRIATVDSYTVFFILLMYLAMFCYYNMNFFDTKFTKTLKPLILCAIFSGFACASKWQGFYAMAGLAVLFFAVIFMRYKEFLYAKKYNDENMMEYYNQMFSSYGMEAYQNVWDTRTDDIKDELSYEKELRERAKETVKTALVYQAIYEDAGLSIDMDAVIAEMPEENGVEYVANMKQNYGDGYMAQAEIKDTVTDYLNNLYNTAGNQE